MRREELGIFFRPKDYLHNRLQGVRQLFRDCAFLDGELWLVDKMARARCIWMTHFN
jgi:hypothetical protein